MSVTARHRIKSLLSLAALAGLAVLAAPQQASAFWSHKTSPRACAPYSDRFDVPGLWLGHFSGGRLAYHASGDKRVDWANEYQCFFSVRECHVWRAGMRREYARFHGYGGCTALRGGGRGVHSIRQGVVARY